MDSRPPLSGQPPRPDLKSDRLDSWKSIGAYLRRDARTAQRWERTQHLPVHRQANAKRGSVFAFTDEVDDWLKTRHPVSRQNEFDKQAAGRTPDVSRHSSSHPRSFVYAGFILASLLVVGVGKLLFSPHADPPQVHPEHRVALAVVPFEITSSDANDRAFANAITQEVIIALKKNSAFRVIPIVASEQSQPGASPLEQIARQYHPEALVEGTVARSGDTIQVVVQLIDVSTGRRIASDQFERTSRAQRPLESELAPLISDSVRTSLLPDNSSP